MQPRPLRKIPPLKIPCKNIIITKEKEKNNEWNQYQPPKIVQPTTVEKWKSPAIPLIKSRFIAEYIRPLILDVEKEKVAQNWKNYNAALD
jgi:hypothetical protein